MTIHLQMTLPKKHGGHITKKSRSTKTLASNPKPKRKPSESQPEIKKLKQPVKKSKGLNSGTLRHKKAELAHCENVSVPEVSKPGSTLGSSFGPAHQIHDLDVFVTKQLRSNTLAKARINSIVDRVNGHKPSKQSDGHRRLSGSSVRAKSARSRTKSNVPGVNTRIGNGIQSGRTTNKTLGGTTGIKKKLPNECKRIPESKSFSLKRPVFKSYTKARSGLKSYIRANIGYITHKPKVLLPSNPYEPFASTAIKSPPAKNTQTALKSPYSESHIGRKSKRDKEVSKKSRRLRRSQSSRLSEPDQHGVITPLSSLLIKKSLFAQGAGDKNFVHWECLDNSTHGSMTSKSEKASRPDGAMGNQQDGIMVGLLVQNAESKHPHEFPKKDRISDNIENGLKPQDVRDDCATVSLSDKLTIDEDMRWQDSLSSSLSKQEPSLNGTSGCSLSANSVDRSNSSSEKYKDSINGVAVDRTISLSSSSQYSLPGCFSRKLQSFLRCSLTVTLHYAVCHELLTGYCVAAKFSKRTTTRYECAVVSTEKMGLLELAVVKSHKSLVVSADTLTNSLSQCASTAAASSCSVSKDHTMIANKIKSDRNVVECESDVGGNSEHGKSTIQTCLPSHSQVPVDEFAREQSHNHQAENKVCNHNALDRHASSPDSPKKFTSGTGSENHPKMLETVFVQRNMSKISTELIKNDSEDKVWAKLDDFEASKETSFESSTETKSLDEVWTGLDEARTQLSYLEHEKETLPQKAVTSSIPESLTTARSMETEQKLCEFEQSARALPRELPVQMPCDSSLGKDKSNHVLNEEQQGIRCNRILQDKSESSTQFCGLPGAVNSDVSACVYNDQSTFAKQKIAFHSQNANWKPSQVCEPEQSMLHNSDLSCKKENSCPPYIVVSGHGQSWATSKSKRSAYNQSCVPANDHSQKSFTASISNTGQSWYSKEVVESDAAVHPATSPKQSLINACHKADTQLTKLKNEDNGLIQQFAVNDKCRKSSLANNPNAEQAAFSAAFLEDDMSLHPGVSSRKSVANNCCERGAQSAALRNEDNRSSQKYTQDKNPRNSKCFPIDSMPNSEHLEKSLGCSTTVEKESLQRIHNQTVAQPAFRNNDYQKFSKQSLVKDAISEKIHSCNSSKNANGHLPTSMPENVALSEQSQSVNRYNFTQHVENASQKPIRNRERCTVQESEASQELQSKQYFQEKHTLHKTASSAKIKTENFGNNDQVSVDCLSKCTQSSRKPIKHSNSCQLRENSSNINSIGGSINQTQTSGTGKETLRASPNHLPAYERANPPITPSWAGDRKSMTLDGIPSCPTLKVNIPHCQTRQQENIVHTQLGSSKILDIDNKSTENVKAAANQKGAGNVSKYHMDKQTVTTTVLSTTAKDELHSSSGTKTSNRSTTKVATNSSLTQSKMNSSAAGSDVDALTIVTKQCQSHLASFRPKLKHAPSSVHHALGDSQSRTVRHYGVGVSSTNASCPQSCASSELSWTTKCFTCVDKSTHSHSVLPQHAQHTNNSQLPPSLQHELYPHERLKMDRADLFVDSEGRSITDDITAAMRGRRPQPVGRKVHSLSFPSFLADPWQQRQRLGDHTGPYVNSRNASLDSTDVDEID